MNPLATFCGIDATDVRRMDVSALVRTFTEQGGRLENHGTAYAASISGGKKHHGATPVAAMMAAAEAHGVKA